MILSLALSADLGDMELLINYIYVVEDIMKKLFTIFLCLMLILSSSALVFAEESEVSVGEARLIPPVQYDEALVYSKDITSQEDIEQWASFQYDESLSEEVKNNILLARCMIVYDPNASGWTADDVTATIVHQDGSEETLPDFNDLYPFWDLEQISSFVYNEEAPASLVDVNNFNTTQQSRSNLVAAWVNVSLPPPQTIGGAQVFGPYSSQSTKAHELYLSSLKTVSSANVWVKNNSTGKDVASLQNLAQGDTAKLSLSTWTGYTFRGNTNNVLFFGTGSFYLYEI